LDLPERLLRLRVEEWPEPGPQPLWWGERGSDIRALACGSAGGRSGCRCLARSGRRWRPAIPRRREPELSAEGRPERLWRFRASE
jgi:hypothetical protein